MNEETNTIRLWIANDEGLYLSSKRVVNYFALRNLIIDANQAGYWFAGVDLEKVDYEALFDSINDE